MTRERGNFGNRQILLAGTDPNEGGVGPGS